MKKINKKGFTLIELLLVIAIIGILAAVLFVSLGSQRDRARETAFKESMRSIVPAATICRDQGGTIQTGAMDGANALCSLGATPVLPGVNSCNGDGTNVTLAEDGTSGGLGTDQWVVTAPCTTSSGNLCTATCDSGGCTFVGPGCN